MSQQRTDRTDPGVSGQVCDVLCRSEARAARQYRSEQGFLKRRKRVYVAAVGVL